MTLERLTPGDDSNPFFLPPIRSRAGCGNPFPTSFPAPIGNQGAWIPDHVGDDNSRQSHPEPVIPGYYRESRKSWISGHAEDDGVAAWVVAGEIAF